MEHSASSGSLIRLEKQHISISILMLCFIPKDTSVLTDLAAEDWLMMPCCCNELLFYGDVWNHYLNTIFWKNLGLFYEHIKLFPSPFLIYTLNIPFVIITIKASKEAYLSRHLHENTFIVFNSLKNDHIVMFDNISWLWRVLLCPMLFSFMLMWTCYWASLALIHNLVKNRLLMSISLGLVM